MLIWQETAALQERSELIDSLLANDKKPEDLIGENGLLKPFTKKRGSALWKPKWPNTWGTPKIRWSPALRATLATGVARKPAQVTWVSCP